MGKLKRGPSFDFRPIRPLLLFYLGVYLLVPFVLIFISLILLASVPLILYRAIIQKYIKLIKPEISGMLSPRSSLLAEDNPFDKPKSNLVLQFVFERRLELRLVMEKMKGLLGRKDGRGGLLYPEFRQSPIKWRGYMFWKPVENFELKDQVKFQNVIDFTEVSKLIGDLLSMPWGKGRPLWEVWVTDVKAEDRTVLLFRAHHTLGDGYTLFKILRDNFAESLPNPGATHAPHLPLKQKRTSFSFRFWTRLSFEYAKVLMFPLTMPIPFEESRTDRPDLIDNNHDNVGSYACAQSPVPIDRVKAISKYFNVPFTSVIFSAYGGALRAHLMRSGKKVPNVVPCFMPVPIREKKMEERLGNFFGAAVPLIPTGKMDPVSRLQLCDSEYQRIKSSTIPFVFLKLFNFCGRMPNFYPLLPLLAKHFYASAWLSNLPAGESFTSCGVLCTGISFSYGLIRGGGGIGVSFISYGDSLRISGIGDASIFSKTDVQEFLKLLDQQFALLENMAIRNVR